MKEGMDSILDAENKGFLVPEFISKEAVVDGLLNAITVEAPMVSLGSLVVEVSWIDGEISGLEELSEGAFKKCSELHGKNLA
jgi:hypothetical protein